MRLRARLSEPWDWNPPQLEIDIPDGGGRDRAWPKGGTVVGVELVNPTGFEAGHPRPEFNEAGWLIGHRVELSLRHRYEHPPSPADGPAVYVIADPGTPEYHLVGYGLIEPADDDA